MMPGPIKTLRKNALRARRGMSEDTRTSASEKICQRVIASREFYASKAVACYLPMADEVDTRTIIEKSWRANKRIYVPVLQNNTEMLFCEITPDSELERSSFGLWEPTRGLLIEPKQLDLVVTPTVAFDCHNNRVGMGGGYYDRCFAFLRHRKHWLRPKLLGVAFQCQEVEEIAPNPWDIPLYRIVTEKK